MTSVHHPEQSLPTRSLFDGPARDDDAEQPYEANVLGGSTTGSFLFAAALALAFGVAAAFATAFAAAAVAAGFPFNFVVCFAPAALGLGLGEAFDFAFGFAFDSEGSSEVGNSQSSLLSIDAI